LTFNERGFLGAFEAFQGFFAKKSRAKWGFERVVGGQTGEGF
jgi:hypothetical protein